MSRNKILALLALPLTLACGDSGYCQSGPVHGTQCSSSAEMTGGAPPSPPPTAIVRPTELPKGSATKYPFESQDAGTLTPTGGKP